MYIIRVLMKKVELIKPKVSIDNSNKVGGGGGIKSALDDVVITVSDLPTVQGNTVFTISKPQGTISAPRVLVPEKTVTSPAAVQNENDVDDEDEYDDDDEDMDGEGDEDFDDDLEETESVAPQTHQTTQLATDRPTVQKRKPRTKKVYPPSDNMFEQLIKLMCEMREVTRKAITMTREAQKCVCREGRDFRNQIKKQKGEKPKRIPRGFAKPAAISNEMVHYLQNVAKITQVDRKIDGNVVGQIKIELGCALARNELTSALCKHFRDSGMRKNDQDHRKIYLDKVTTQLFGIDVKKFTENGGIVSENGEPIITYFDLPKYIPRHCGKNSVGH
jgi:hypothetical protein